MKLRWRFGLIAAVFLAIFSLYPQFKLIYLRGDQWQGHYAYNDIDEVAYASYVKALTDGRPRKNDPYTGNDDSAETPQPESLFSIQFAAPYTLALPARLLGISTPWAMTLGGALAAALTALAIFWFLFRLSGSNWFAMAGSLVTLAGGAVFAGEGAASEVFFDGFSYPYFPGFRRYIPALAMPAFFSLVGLLWKLFVDRGSADGPDVERAPWSFRSLEFRTLLFAWLAFAYVVFSYFYVWTTAAALMGCLLMCWALFRPTGFSRDIKAMIAVGAGCIFILAPYAYLLSNRSHTMDDVQLLVRTHAPDLTRFPEYIAGAAFLILMLGIALKRIEFRSPSALFVLSMGLSVFAVFNQQVVTGQSLQPIHYQVFIGNYVAGLALVSSIGLMIRPAQRPEPPIAKAALAAMAFAAVAWGFVECHYTVRVLDDVNVARDEQMPLGRRLTELAAGEPNRYKSVVLHFGVAEADDLPTIAPQATLWSRHQHVFTTITTEENKQRYYQYLHFQGITGEQLANSMRRGDFVSMIALFGWGRHTDRLNANFKRLTVGEIETEARNYDRFIAAFDPHKSPETIVSYLVVRSDDIPDLSNFDRWYERDSGEQYGPFTLYRTKLKNNGPASGL